MIKAYYLLTKPGIIYSNVLTAIGGYFFAAKGHIIIGSFLAMVLGLAGVIASACVFNNYIDRAIDAKMHRTKNRALVTHVITARQAIAFAVILGMLGFYLLLFFTNVLTAFVAFIGFFFYVIVYSFEKRRSEFGTLVGSISGAVPPVVGYCAVTNRIDIAAGLLFFILVFWQMPHFYAIATFRSDDYAAALLPVLPVKKGISHTKVHILFYIAAFIIAVSLLTVFHYTGYTYLLIMGGLGVAWFVLSLRGFRSNNDNRWARKLFFLSLIIIVALSLLLSFNTLLP